MEEEEEQPESMDVDSPVSLKDELPYEPLSIEVNDKYFTFWNRLSKLFDITIVPNQFRKLLHQVNRNSTVRLLT